MKESAAPQAMTLADARHEADVLHRSGGVALLTLAAFWGIAAALAQWGTPTAGQVALLLGTLAAHPVSWMVLKLVGGPVMMPRTNPLGSLFYEIVAIQVAGVVVGIIAAQSKPSLFFAISLMGLGAGLLPTAFLYGKNLYLLAGGVFVLLPAVCAFVATPLVPWFGLVGVVLLIVTGGLFLRIDGGIGLPMPRSIMGEKVGESDSGQDQDPGSGSGDLSASSAAPRTTLDDDPYGLRDDSRSPDGSYDATDSGNDDGKDSA